MNLPKRPKATPPRTDKDTGHRVYSTNGDRAPKASGRFNAPSGPPEHSIFGDKAYSQPAQARRPKAGAPKPARPR